MQEKDEFRYFSEMIQTIDVDDISNIVSTYPGYLFRVLKQAALAHSAVAAWERKKSSDLNQLVREQRSGNLTQKDAEAAVRSSPQYLKTCDSLLQAQKNAALWDALAEAFRARGHAIRERIKLAMASGELAYYKAPQENGR